MRKNVLLAVAGLSLSVAGAAQAELIYGITGSTAGGSLFFADSANPGAATVINDFSLVPGTQLLPGHGVRAIDFRPATGELYAISTLGSDLSQGQLYTVNLATASLTRVGTGFTIPGQNTVRVSMDFNPVADRVRVVTSSGALNYRLNPNTGALVNIDTPLAYVAGDPNAGTNPPFVVGVAYANNVAGATSTREYVWDFDLDVLAEVTNFNGGTMSTVGPGDPSGFITFDGGVGLDISGATGIAYMSFDDSRSTGQAETLATVNLSTGLVTTIGLFNPLNVLDISVFIPSPSAAAFLGLGALAAARRRRA